MTALPPPPRNLDGPVNGGNQRFTQAEVDPPLAPQNPTAATPTPQGQPQEISLNRSAPVPAARHQGYSARTHTPHPVLTPSSPSTAVTTDGSREIAGLRLHGSPSPPPAPTAPPPDAVGLDGPAAPSTNGSDSASGDLAESVTREPATPVIEEEPAAIAPPATPEVQVQTPDPATVPASYSTEVVPSLNGDHPTPEVLIYQGSPQFSNHLRFDLGRFEAEDLDSEGFDPEAKTRPTFSDTKLTPTPQPLTRSRETRSGHQSQGPIRVTAQQACFPSANQRPTRDEAPVPLATRVARLQQKHRQGDANPGDRCATFSVTTDKASAQGEAP
ncbi:MAG: hypothetical protein EA342_17840 [Leptolyngbya sp. LCM1.Bin17]|nr:MAG: hypothetical protein EA342_17840 [Leptolyngbya sp. LCM1.Bin17]